VLVNWILSPIDGGKRLADLAAVRNQPELFESLASKRTASRTIDSVDKQVREVPRMNRARPDA
jgi:hypothetical protein